MVDIGENSLFEKGLMNTISRITTEDSVDYNLKRENANINGDAPMGAMLKCGSEVYKYYNLKELINPVHAALHIDGFIHIHDLDFYALTTTCTQIDLTKLFDGGFSTGSGFLREPQSISAYTALACIAIQSNQNDQHGGQSIPNFDYAMAPGVKKTYLKNLVDIFEIKYGDLSRGYCRCLGDIVDFKAEINKYDGQCVLGSYKFDEHLAVTIEKVLRKYFFSTCECVSDVYNKASEIISDLTDRALKKTKRDTYQAMEAFLHNLNTMQSRAGSQIPFSSINYGTDTSEEGRLAIKCLLDATWSGLGLGETPIFPIQIFKMKSGVSFEKADKNYDLFKLACKVSAKRLFPNFINIDAPFNLQYYVKGRPETEVAQMGCRTRVFGNVYNPNNEVVFGRGNLSFTSINLPRLALQCRDNPQGAIKTFFDLLESYVDIVHEQLYDRYLIQAKRKVKNFPFLMGQGVWIDSDKLDYDDEVGEVLKNGSLSTGFIGLAECLKVLTGFHQGESEESQELGLQIIQFMRDLCDKRSQKTKMNYTLVATPAEGLAGRFVKQDREMFGDVDGVTDREYYTNSFHIPVYYNTTILNKIRTEAPYHEITNGGHITYIELDGDPLDNLDAFEAVVKAAHDFNIGYFAINHEVDRDPVCGYVGIIRGECPRCGRKDGEAVSMEKLKELKKIYPEIILPK